MCILSLGCWFTCYIFVSNLIIVNNGQTKYTALLIQEVMIARKHELNVHLYGDDPQLYVTFNPTDEMDIE